MSENINETNQFSQSAFFKSILPAYFFPLIMSGGPGYILDKPQLLKASYSSIALPSLIATIICFLLLKYLSKKQIFLLKRIPCSAFLILIIGLLSLLTINLFGLYQYLLDIIPSALIAAIIIGMTKPLNKITNHE